MVSCDCAVAPILVSAAIVFVASSVIHMFWATTRRTTPPCPPKTTFQARCASSPAAPATTCCRAPRTEGHAVAGLPRQGEPRAGGGHDRDAPGRHVHGRNLALWFVYCVIVSLFAGYVAGVVPAAGHRLHARVPDRGHGRLRGLTRSPCGSTRSGTSARGHDDPLDDRRLIYALLTAGTFGWLWPR